MAVINKSDLAPKIDRAEIDKHFKEIVTVSALSGEGLPALQNAAARALKTAELNPNDGILYTERQRADVQKALTALEEAENALLMGMTWDAVTVSLEGAIAALNELTGERVSVRWSIRYLKSSAWENKISKLLYFIFKIGSILE